MTLQQKYMVESQLCEGWAQGFERTAAWYDGRVAHALRFGITEAEVWARGKARRMREKAGMCREKARKWRCKAEQVDTARRDARRYDV